jgi:hypothetical protein
MKKVTRTRCLVGLLLISWVVGRAKAEAQEPGTPPKPEERGSTGTSSRILSRGAQQGAPVVGPSGTSSGTVAPPTQPGMTTGEIQRATPGTAPARAISVPPGAGTKGVAPSQSISPRAGGARAPGGRIAPESRSVSLPQKGVAPSQSISPRAGGARAPEGRIAPESRPVSPRPKGIAPSQSISPPARGAQAPKGRIAPENRSVSPRPKGIAPSQSISPPARGAQAPKGRIAPESRSVSFPPKGIAPARSISLPGGRALGAAQPEDIAPTLSISLPPTSPEDTTEHSLPRETPSPPLEPDSETVPAPPPGEAPPRIEIPPRPPSAKELEASFRARYEIEEVSLHLEDGPAGPRGSFVIRGDLTPAGGLALDAASGDRREIAQAFIREEASNFGLSRVEELHEAGADTSPIGWTTIAYHRYVGDLRLEDASLIVRIDPDGAVRSISGRLVPLPDELFEAAAQPTLTPAQVVAVVSEAESGTDDSGGPFSVEGMYGGSARLLKWATSSPPYVVWEVSAGQYKYRVDAFSGAILGRSPLMIPAR